MFIENPDYGLLIKQLGESFYAYFFINIWLIVLVCNEMYILEMSDCKLSQYVMSNKVLTP